jgi:predicted regulator of Ras-like GTPase activity (Roadblock/LC7/MglB family)
MAINSEKLSALLQNFVSSTNDVQGAAVVTPDGLPLATSLPAAIDEERAAAMSAAMLSLGERISSEFARGDVDRIFVEGEKGYGILTSCGEDAVFLVLASQAAKQGLLMLEIKRALGELKLLLN